MPPEKMKQEKNLVDDADTHRDPSASETPRTDAEVIRCEDKYHKLYPASKNRPVDDAFARTLERNLQQCRTKLAEVERERDELRADCEKHCAELDLRGSVAESHCTRANLAETRLTHSEAVRAELAGLALTGADLAVRFGCSIEQEPVAEAFKERVEAAHARHRAAPPEKKEGQL